nr:hypothetical protein [Nannocystis pusilla]
MKPERSGFPTDEVVPQGVFFALGKLEERWPHQGGEREEHARLEDARLADAVLAADDEDVRVVFHQRCGELERELVDRLEVLDLEPAQFEAGVGPGGLGRLGLLRDGAHERERIMRFGRVTRPDGRMRAVRGSECAPWQTRHRDGMWRGGGVMA